MPIHKLNVARIADSLDTPFLMRSIAQVDHFTLYLYLCQGFVSRHVTCVKTSSFSCTKAS